MKSSFIKQALPHIVAVAIFLSLTLAYVYPVLEGKKIFQPDIMNHIGMSKEISDFREKTGDEALWTNSMFGGMPAYQISVQFKNNIARFLHKIITLGLPRPADMVFLYFIGFYILLLALGISPWLAIAGSMAFAFSSYHFIILEAGHNSKAVAIAYMAPVLAGIITALRGQLARGGLMTAIYLSLQIFANHFQVTYYLLIIVLLIGMAFLVDAILRKQYLPFAKAIGVLVLAAMIALTLNITNLWTTWEYSKFTIRGGSDLTHNQQNNTATGLDKDYATAWSYGISESFSLFIPNVKGGATGSLSENKNAMSVVDSDSRKWVGSQNHYWGEQPFTSGPVYVGAIIFFLFVFGALAVKGYLKWALLAATLLSILLAWGRNFMPLTDFFLDYVPGYSKFRAVSMTLIIAELTIPILALMALKEIVANPRFIREKLDALLIALSMTGMLALAFYVFPNIFFHFSSGQEIESFNQFKTDQPTMTATVDALWKQLEAARTAVFRADALRSLLFIIATVALLWIYSLGKLKQGLFIGIVSVLILIDMWPVDRRYLSEKDFVNRRQVEKPYQPTAADQLILKDVDPHYRVINLTTNTFNETATSYFHRSIGGYHGAKLRRFQDLIEHHISQGNTKVLDMLNTKYIIRPDENKQPTAQLNMQAMGNAWLVSHYEVVENADAENEALNKIDLKSWIVVDKRFESELEGKAFEPDMLASIALVKYAPNKMTYKAQTKTRQIAVFSEVYYDRGWNAYLDGKPVKHFRANYLLRAMVLPAGNHEIEFRFEPKSYYLGQKITLAGSVLLVFLTIAFAWSQYKTCPLRTAKKD